MHCRRFIGNGITRRDMLLRCGNGFGALAAAAMLGQTVADAADQTGTLAEPSGSNPVAPKLSHFAAKARSVIFLFMDGGPSQVDTFDPKPRLDREHGQPIKVKTHPTQFNNVGNVLGCPWKFRRWRVRR
jgi:hypothetical protein